MSAIFCALPGSPGPSDRDLAVIAQMRAAMERRAPYTGPIDPYFDGDVHQVAPDVTDRRDFIIVDGKLELP